MGRKTKVIQGIEQGVVLCNHSKYVLIGEKLDEEVNIVYVGKLELAFLVAHCKDPVNVSGNRARLLDIERMHVNQIQGRIRGGGLNFATLSEVRSLVLNLEMCHQSGLYEEMKILGEAGLTTSSLYSKVGR